MASETISIDTRQLRAAATIIRREQKRLNPELRLVVQRILKDARTAMTAATPRAQDTAATPPGKTHAQDQWHAATNADGGGQLTNDAPYLPFQFLGTQVHFIAPIAGRLGANGRPAALAFSVGGAFAFSRGHDVSGVPVNHGLVDALTAQRVMAEERIAATGEAVLVRTHVALDAVAKGAS